MPPSTRHQNAHVRARPSTSRRMINKAGGRLVFYWSARRLLLVTCPLPYGPPPYASCTQPYHPSSSRPSTCREPSSLPSAWPRRSSSQSYHPSVSYEHRCRGLVHKPATRPLPPERLPIQTV